MFGKYEMDSRRGSSTSNIFPLEKNTLIIPLKVFLPSFEIMEKFKFSLGKIYSRVPLRWAKICLSIFIVCNKNLNGTGKFGFSAVNGFCPDSSFSESD
jgi:hypothetical protein